MLNQRHHGLLSILQEALPKLYSYIRIGKQLRESLIRISHGQLHSPKGSIQEPCRPIIRFVGTVPDI